MSKKIVIIGGGISGLTAGVYARQAGFDVDIYESHLDIGGMCTHWVRKGELCTSAVHWMMGSREGSDLHEIWKTTEALDDATEMFTLDYISACPDGSNGYCYVYSDINKLESELLNLSPQDEEAIKGLIRDVKLYQQLPIPASKPIELMLPMERAICFAPFVRVRKRTSLGGVSIAKYVDRFRSPLIRHLLTTIIPDTRVDVDSLMIWLAVSCNGDTAFPRYGFYEMAKRVERKFLSLGGKIHLNAEVEKIVVKEGIATGIVLADGREVRADYLIPTVSPDVLLWKLLDNRFEDTYYEERLRAPDRFPTPKLTLVNMSVDGDLSHLPHTLTIEPHTPVIINNGAIKYIKINHYSFTPTFRKDYKGLIQAVLQEQGFEYWEKLKAQSPVKYRQTKEELAHRVIEEIEAVYPDIKGKIKLLDVATPLTFRRYCNSFKGAYLSFYSTNGGYNDNHPGMISGIGNMYLAGQWVFHDGGLPMAVIAGKFAAQRVCNQENINHI